MVVLGAFFVMNLILGVLSGLVKAFHNDDGNIILVQRVLEREGEGPISGGFPTVASEAADGGGLARLR